MSRFFRSASDSESETDSDESILSDESSSEEEEEEQQQEQQTRSRFLKGGDDSDEDSDEDSGRKKAETPKEKIRKEIEALAEKMEDDKDNLESDSADKKLAKAALTEDVKELAKKAKQLLKLADSLPVEDVKSLSNAIVKAYIDLETFLDTLDKKALNLGTLIKELKRFLSANKTAVEMYNKKPESPMRADAGQDEGLAEEDDGFQTVGRQGKKVTKKTVLAALTDLRNSRGKKKTNREEQIKELESLLPRAASPFETIVVLLTLIDSHFEPNSGSASHMDIGTWKSIEKELSQLFELLERHPSFKDKHQAANDKDPYFIICEDADELDLENDGKRGAKEIVKIRGSMITFVVRLDDEFTKSLQNIDPHTTEYIDRLKDEPSLYALLVRSQVYFEKHKMNNSIATTIYRRLDHLYYKPEQVIRSIENLATQCLPKYISSSIITEKEPTLLINELCKYLYNDESEQAVIRRTHAMLYHIYHYALHKDFHKARDMLLMSHLQELIQKVEIPAQILYNRVMVQIGLCAFHHGLIKDAHACLQEIQTTGKVKELLAQGISSRQNQPQQSNAPEVDPAEKDRLLPFHMHINLELLECIFLTCSMLLEIPAQAQTGPNYKRVISRPFRRLLDYNERQAFTGPPENTRDHIMGASKALASGEWEKARDYILAIKIWDLMPEKEKITEMLTRKIQEEGLRTYLFTYAPYYSTVSLEKLSGVFDLPITSITAIVSKMIWNEELSASLDQVTQCVILHQVELTPLQAQALQFSEKVANLVEQNERLEPNERVATGGRTERMRA